MTSNIIVHGAGMSVHKKKKNNNSQKTRFSSLENLNQKPLTFLYVVLLFVKQKHMWDY